MDSQTNQSRIEQSFAAMSQGDMNPLLALLAPDIRWTVTGDTPFSGTTTGVEAMQAKLGGFLVHFAEPWVVKITKIAAADDHVFVALEGSATGTSGSSYSQRYCVLYRFQADLVVEIQEFPDTQKLMQFLETQEAVSQKGASQ